MRTEAISALFILAFVAAIIGGILFTGRKIWQWSNAQSQRYLYWERSIWIAGMILLTLGFVLFCGTLQAEGESVLSQLALTGFVLGAALIVVAESYSLDTGNWASYMIRLAVYLLFLSQAVSGAAMLQVELLPQWLGWATIIYNLVLLLLLFRAKDPYYPAAHFIMPLVIAVVLIV